MSRVRKLQGLIDNANAEQDHRIYLGYLWKESAERKKKRKQAKASRKRNRKK